MSPDPRSIVLPLLCACSCLAPWKGGSEPIASRSALLAEDMDVAVAAASPMSVIAPIGMPIWGNNPQSEQSERRHLDSIAQRLQFRADVTDRLAKVDQRMTVLARFTDPDELRPLRRAREDVEQQRVNVAAAPDEDLDRALIALNESLDVLERALTDFERS